MKTAVAIASFKAVQMSPAAPELSARQKNDTTGQFTVTPPAGALLAEAVVIKATLEDAEAYRNNFEGAMARPEAQYYSALPGGAATTEEFIIDEFTDFAVLARADMPE
jgi:hypothetical protein